MAIGTRASQAWGRLPFLGHSSERRVSRIRTGLDSAEQTRPSAGQLISVAGAQGGAGATTIGLLVAHAHERASQGPVLAVDLAGPSRGGLALLAGAATPMTAEAVAACTAIHRRSVAEPFALTDASVRILGAMPGVADALERTHESLVAQLAAQVAAGVGDMALGVLARQLLDEHRCWEAIRWDNDEVVDGVGALLDSAVEHHELVIVDLGTLQSAAIANVVAARADLHIWAVPGRLEALELAKRRLPTLDFSTTGEEVIVVWHADPPAPSPARLAELGATRAATVIRFPHYGSGNSAWPQRVSAVEASLGELRARLPNSRRS